MSGRIFIDMENGSLVPNLMIALMVIVLSAGAAIGASTIFDDTQARHSFQPGVNMLNFAGSPPNATTAGNKIITLADYGKVITLQVNESFLLKLGEGYDWNITVDNRTVLGRVMNVLVVRGAQGIYEAHNPGKAILTAIGDPVCRKEQPPCATPSREFHVYVIVTDGSSTDTPAFETFFAISALIAALLVVERKKKGRKRGQ